MNQKGFGGGFNGGSGNNPFENGNFGNVSNKIQMAGNPQGKRIVSKQRTIKTKTINGKTTKVTT